MITIPREMQGFMCVLLILFLIILFIITRFVDVTAPLNQIGITIFVVVYWIIGVILSVIVCIKLELEFWKGRKKKEDNN